MTRRTLEKMERAMKAMRIAQESFSKDVVDAKSEEWRTVCFNKYQEFFELDVKVRQLYAEIETILYLKEKQG